VAAHVTELPDAFEINGRKIPVIGLDALLKNKRAAGREQDLADVAALQAVATSPRRPNG